MYKLTGIIFVLLLLTTPAVAQDLKVEKDDDPNPVRENGILTYTVTVTNQGPGAVTTPITVKDTLPDNVKVIGVFTSDEATCTANDEKVECKFAGGLAAPVGSDQDKLTLTINVQPQQTGEITNKVEGSFAAEATNADNKDEITTDVNAASRDGRHPGGRATRLPRVPPNAFRQYEVQSDLNQAESDLQDAENELSMAEGEDTLSEDSGNSGLSADGAEASTPGAVASANGDEDTLGPVGPQGDVVNDIPESGPLPNTGGVSLWVLGSVAAFLLLGTAVIRRLW